MADQRSHNCSGNMPLAIYANYCEVGHNAFEFLIDYGQFRPEAGAVQIHSRIVSGPVQAKLFARLLGDAVLRYEAQHGAIPDFDRADPLGALMAPQSDFDGGETNEPPLSPGAAAPTPKR
jgi:Protein of unknown function (DUF3467)